MSSQTTSTVGVARSAPPVLRPPPRRVPSPTSRPTTPSSSRASSSSFALSPASRPPPTPNGPAAPTVSAPRSPTVRPLPPPPPPVVVVRTPLVRVNQSDGSTATVMRPVTGETGGDSQSSRSNAPLVPVRSSSSTPAAATAAVPIMQATRVEKEEVRPNVVTAQTTRVAVAGVNATESKTFKNEVAGSPGIAAANNASTPQTASEESTTASIVLLRPTARKPPAPAAASPAPAPAATSSNFTTVAEPVHSRPTSSSAAAAGSGVGGSGGVQTSRWQQQQQEAPVNLIGVTTAPSSSSPMVLHAEFDLRPQTKRRANHALPPHSSSSTIWKAERPSAVVHKPGGTAADDSLPCLIVDVPPLTSSFAAERENAAMAAPPPTTTSWNNTTSRSTPPTTTTTTTPAGGGTFMATPMPVKQEDPTTTAPPPVPRVSGGAGGEGGARRPAHHQLESPASPTAGRRMPIAPTHSFLEDVKKKSSQQQPPPLAVTTSSSSTTALDVPRDYPAILERRQFVEVALRHAVAPVAPPTGSLSHRDPVAEVSADVAEAEERYWRQLHEEKHQLDSFLMRKDRAPPVATSSSSSALFGGGAMSSSAVPPTGDTNNSFSHRQSQHNEGTAQWTPRRVPLVSSSAPMSSSRCPAIQPSGATKRTAVVPPKSSAPMHNSNHPHHSNKLLNNPNVVGASSFALMTDEEERFEQDEEVNGEDVYAPTASRWVRLEQAEEKQKLKSVGNLYQRGPSVPSDHYQPVLLHATRTPCLPDSNTMMTTPKLNPPSPTLVTFSIAVIFSEQHLVELEQQRRHQQQQPPLPAGHDDGDEWALDFDPVGEVRITRCNLATMTVERLLHLLHRSLNFRPYRKGVLRYDPLDNTSHRSNNNNSINNGCDFAIDFHAPASNTGEVPMRSTTTTTNTISTPPRAVARTLCPLHCVLSDFFTLRVTHRTDLPNHRQVDLQPREKMTVVAPHNGGLTTGGEIEVRLRWIEDGYVPHHHGADAALEGVEPPPSSSAGGGRSLTGSSRTTPNVSPVRRVEPHLGRFPPSGGDPQRFAPPSPSDPSSSSPLPDTTTSQWSHTQKVATFEPPLPAYASAAPPPPPPPAHAPPRRTASASDGPRGGLPPTEDRRGHKTEEDDDEDDALNDLLDEIRSHPRNPDARATTASSSSPLPEGSDREHWSSRNRASSSSPVRLTTVSITRDISPDEEDDYEARKVAKDVTTSENEDDRSAIPAAARSRAPQPHPAQLRSPTTIVSAASTSSRRTLPTVVRPFAADNGLMAGLEQEEPHMASKGRHTETQFERSPDDEVEKTIFVDDLEEEEEFPHAEAIDVDGALYVPTSPRMQKLANEIAALRAALAMK